MKIGIISDTHDDVGNVKKAIEMFNVERVQYVIHVGDYICPGIVKEFEKLNSKLIGVLGNNDGEKVHLLKNFLDIGGDLKGELAEIELDGLRFGVYHGTSKDFQKEELSFLMHKLKSINSLICPRHYFFVRCEQKMVQFNLSLTVAVRFMRVSKVADTHH